MSSATGESTVDESDHTCGAEDDEQAAHAPENVDRAFGAYLPPDETHPPRLNVPIWRHLTFDEAHAAEVGLIGSPTALGFLTGGPRVKVVLVALSALVLKVVMFDLPNQSQAGKLVGSEAAYFITTFFLSALFTAVLVE